MVQFLSDLTDSFHSESGSQMSRKAGTAELLRRGRTAPTWIAGANFCTTPT